MSKSKFDRLYETLEREIARFDQESTKHKRMFRRLRYVALSLTAAGTLFASANLVFSDIDSWLNFLVVIVTASAGVIASIEGIRKPSELWMIERNVFHSLNDLKRELDFDGDAMNEEKLNDAFARMQATLYSSRQRWSRDIRAQTETHENVEQSHALEPTAGPVSNGEPSPPAQ